MKVKAAAERLEVSTGTVYALIAAGKLRCHRLGVGRGAIRISEEQLAEFLAGAAPVVVPPPVPPVKPQRVKLKHLHR